MWLFSVFKFLLIIPNLIPLRDARRQDLRETGLGGGGTTGFKGCKTTGLAFQSWFPLVPSVLVPFSPFSLGSLQSFQYWFISVPSVLIPLSPTSLGSLQSLWSCIPPVPSVMVLQFYFPLTIVSLKLKIFLCNSSTCFNKKSSSSFFPYFLLSQINN